MEKKRDKRVFAGFYLGYDGNMIYVVTVVKDADTGEDIVICQKNIYSQNPEYFTMTKASFCNQVLRDGKYADKFVRQAKYQIGELRIHNLKKDGLPTPRRKKESPDEYLVRNRRSATNYRDYAKDLCEHYLEDLRTYNLCVEQKRYIDVLDKKDFEVLKEDLIFLNNCKKTILREYYNAYFKERFCDGKSIRKYADEHSLNRGSVDYIQKKLFTVLATALRDRDVADGKVRLRTPYDEDDE